MSDRPRLVAEALTGWSGKAGPIAKVPGCTGADVATAIGADTAHEGPREHCAKVAAELARGRVAPDRLVAVAIAADKAAKLGLADSPEGEADPSDPSNEAEGRKGLAAIFREALAGADPAEVWEALRAATAEHNLPLEWLPPRPVDANRHPRPLLPVVQSASEAPEREAGRLAFGGILDGRELPAQLPLLEAPDGPRVPLLELADCRGGPIMTKGRGAPLDLRLFVGACLWTPHRARKARTTLVVTVRELRDWLWPRGWERRRDWPRLRAALWKARDYTIPDGGGLWLPFALRRDPGADASLDDCVVIDVELPPGAGNGPAIDRGILAALGVDSAPRYRAYIAAHSVAWIPGRTRVTHPRNRTVRLWSGDPAKYTALTREDRRRLAYGDGDKRNRTRGGPHGIDTPWENLPGVEIVGRKVDGPDGRRGWLVLPAAAAERIRAKLAKRRKE